MENPATIGINKLNINSTCDEIATVMDDYFKFCLIELTHKMSDRRTILMALFDIAPIEAFSPDEYDYWSKLEKATREMIGVQMAYETQLSFFTTLLMVTNQNVNIQEYKKAKNKLMADIGMQIMDSPIEKINEHTSTLNDLTMAFISLTPK